MKILTVNNKKEEKFLRRRTADFDFSAYSAAAGKESAKKELNELIGKMRETMIAANGIGLSANQIGLGLRLFVAQISKEPLKRDEKNKIIMPPSDKAEFYAIFNPEIIKFSKEKTTMEEGCLSVPRVYGLVDRPASVVLAGQNETGKQIEIKARGLMARVFQHETDHLNGILFTDKARDIHKIE